MFFAQPMLMLKRGFIYGLIGLIMEVMWTGFCSLVEGDLSLRAHTSLLMLPIYGLAVFLEPMFYALQSLKLSVPIRGLCYAVMIFACEYISGKILTAAGICPWQYSGPFSVEGLIRLDYLPLWAGAGLFFEQIHLRLFPDKGLLFVSEERIRG